MRFLPLAIFLAVVLAPCKAQANQTEAVNKATEAFLIYSGARAYQDKLEAYAYNRVVRLLGENFVVGSASTYHVLTTKSANFNISKYNFFVSLTSVSVSFPLEKYNFFISSSYVSVSWAL